MTPLPYQAEMTEAQRKVEIRGVLREVVEENTKKMAMAHRYRKQRKNALHQPRQPHTAT